MRLKNSIFLLALTIFAIVGCSSIEQTDNSSSFNGNYNREYVMTLTGFEENRSSILSATGVTVRDFEVWSTMSTTKLNSDERDGLKLVREAVESPTSSTLLQKVITLSRLGEYMDNVGGGVIGGFMTVAADTKNLVTLEEVYNGLRLDYTDSEFVIDGGGYGVLRFFLEQANELYIPYDYNMGGVPHDSWAWPWGGGGFTTSIIGDGGYPEYVIDNYYTPIEGSELYEVTPEGREILRSTFTNGKWTTYENPSYSVVN